MFLFVAKTIQIVAVLVALTGALWLAHGGDSARLSGRLIHVISINIIMTRMMMMMLRMMRMVSLLYIVAVNQLARLRP